MSDQPSPEVRRDVQAVLKQIARRRLKEYRDEQRLLADGVPPCGHAIKRANGRTLTCERPAEHRGWHWRRDKRYKRLLKGMSWGDDGLLAGESKDAERARYGSM